MAKIIYGVSDIDTMMAGKQDELTAGTGIDITDNVISVTASGGMTAHTFASFNELASALISNPNHILIMKDTSTQIQVMCTTRTFGEIITESFIIDPNGKITAGSSEYIFYGYGAFSIAMDAATTTSLSTTQREVRINMTSGDVSTNTFSKTFAIADFIAYY